MNPAPVYTNRELSWLEFNQRVLDQAIDQSTPLLEQLKFLAISGSNLDEFFMVRVGGLMLQAEKSPEATGIADMGPAEQLRAIRQRVKTMVDDQYQCFDATIAALANNGIRRLQTEELTPSQRDHLEMIFEEEISPVVSPIAVQDAHDFPRMIGATFGLCLRLDGPELGEEMLGEAVKSETIASDQRFVVVPVRRGLARIWTVPSDEGTHFVMLEDILSMFADRFFRNHEILESVAFRTMRNADVTIDEGAADLLAGMKQMLLQRRTAACVRLEFDSRASAETVEFLKGCLEISDDQMYRIPGPIDLSALMSLATISGFRDLNFEPWPSQSSPDFPAGDNVFNVIAQGDRVLVHPYQSYQPVVDFVVTAATDPQVIAIKQTLYRTSRDSEIVNALRTAAESGKHVTAIVELRARFDENRNIEWARKLEEAGVDVIYGVRGLKTHAKICLVVRKETGGVRRYLHVGTGNYNEATARMYSDISLFTCDPEIGVDAVNLFNAITGLSIPQPMTRLVAAPIELRKAFRQMIDVEIASALDGRPAMIRAKVNSLVDQQIIDHLYEASQAGVRIELNVRGMCCLRPGIPGLSENIRVISIIDRVLEHARIFYFLHGGDHRVFIASADWMGRNLDRRIELMIPVTDSGCATRVIKTLQSFFDDNVNSYSLNEKGFYDRLTPQKSKKNHRSQQHLYQIACQLQDVGISDSHQTIRPYRAKPEQA